MENVRKHKNVKLVNSLEKRNKLIMKPNFSSMKIFNENLTAIDMKKTNLKLLKPVYCGFTIADNSELRMYDFHKGQI